MKTLSILLALTMAFAGAASASARDRHQARKSYDKDRTQHQRRTSTMDREGRCQRDTGRTMNSLDLDNPCDRQEFWARFNDMGGNRR